MDDFDRLRAIRRSNLDGEGYGQNYERPDLDELKEKEPPLVDPIMIKAAVCGFLIYFLIFFVLIHPLEKIQYKMAYYGSYCITISTGSSTQRMYVDGNVMKVGEAYYEVSADGTFYVYSQIAPDKWVKRIDYEQSVGGEDWLGDILNKYNYDRNYLKWQYFEMEEGKKPLGMTDVTTQVIFGRCKVTGKVQASFGFTATVKITIDQFGMVDLTLPEVV